MTPLHYAAHDGHLEVCKAIMEKLENKNPKDNFGDTPKDMAHTNGHNMIVELFSNSSDHTFALCTFLFLFLTEVVLWSTLESSAKPLVNCKSDFGTTL